MQHWLNRQKSEIQSSNFVKSEVWNLKYEVWSRKSEVGSRKSEARSRKTLLGFRNTQIEQNYDFYVFRGYTLRNNFFVLTCKQKTTIYLHCRVINNNSYWACDWLDLKTLSKCEQQYKLFSEKSTACLRQESCFFYFYFLLWKNYEICKLELRENIKMD